jgi:hypothetical protein
MKTAFAFIALLLFTNQAVAQGTTENISIGTLSGGFSTGMLASLHPVTKAPTLHSTLTFGDAVLRDYFGDVCVVNRAGGDNLQILDVDNDYVTLHQFTTGNGSNPHDVYFASPTVAYVSRYDMTTVLKMNPTTGAGLGTIDLAMFADADGLPEMDQMFATGGRLYVALQRLDRPNFYVPVGTSLLAVIDLATDTLIDMDAAQSGIQGIVLPRTNPYSEVGVLPLDVWEHAYFSCVGFFGLQDGGVVKCDADDPSQTSVILTEAEAGGDILDVEIVSDTEGFAIVANASFITVLIAFNPTTGTKTGPTMYTPAGYDLTDVECNLEGTTLFLCDRTPTNAGVRCFDVATHGQIPNGPIDVGLPPFDVLVQGRTTTGVGDAPIASSLGQNYPNPFNPETSIPFTLGSDGRVVLRVFDVNGRLVATLLDENRDAGQHVAHWNGRDARGRASSSGVYFVQLQANGATETRKIALLK